MLRIVVILLVAAAAWMGWWAFGSIAYERGLNTWIEARRAEGWAADVATLETRGFPNRFDTTLSEVRLADPATGVAWSAPFLQFLSLSYRPNEVIAVLPEQHSFATPLQQVTISHDRARGSLFLAPSTSLPLQSARVVVDALDVASSLDWSVRLDEGRFAAELAPATETTYRIGSEMLGLAPSAGMLRVLDPGKVLPGKIKRVRLDATIRFTAPWDRRAIEDARPQIETIDLTDLSARWGSVNFRAAGALRVNKAGVPTGEITVRAVDWRRLLAMAVSAGLVPEAVSGALESAFELLGGRRDTLDVPLEFRGGQVRLGPLPLGPAPRIVIR